MHIHQNINMDINRVIQEFDANEQKRIALVFMIKMGISPLTTNHQKIKT